MQNAIAVSVVVPSRNCLTYLPQALESIKRQDFGATEILVIDDGSTDGTWAWLSEPAKREYPGLRPLRTSGIGVNAARNLALKEARGVFAAFLDADDVWLPGKLQPQVAYMGAHAEAALSFTNYRCIDPSGIDHGDAFGYWARFAARSRMFQGFSTLANAAAEILAGNVVGTSTVVARRDVLLGLGGFDESLSSAADWDMWLRLAQAGKVGCSPEILADYLMRPGSITSDKNRRRICMERIIERHAPKIALASPWAVRHARSKLRTADAESASTALQAFRHHVSAWVQAPSLRLAKAAMADLARVTPGLRR